MYDNLIQPETSDAVRKPLLEASTLPAHCYTSEEFHQREIEQIFLANWQLAGRMEQVSEPGQYFCYEGIGGSVIIMRSKGDEVNAFAIAVVIVVRGFSRGAESVSEFSVRIIAGYTSLTVS